VQQETKRIPLAGPLIDERDEELVVEVLRSGWLSLGPMGPRFEEATNETGEVIASSPGPSPAM